MILATSKFVFNALTSNKVVIQDNLWVMAWAVGASSGSLWVRKEWLYFHLYIDCSVADSAVQTLWLDTESRIIPGIRRHLPAVCLHLCRLQLVRHPVASTRSGRLIIWNIRSIDTVCESDHKQKLSDKVDPSWQLLLKPEAFLPEPLSSSLWWKFV